MAQSDRDCPDSPPASPANETLSRKPIKPPTVTPRRFEKFFNPVRTYKIQRNVRTSRRALQDITNPPSNQKHSTPFARLIGHDGGTENISPCPAENRGSKRKLSFASIESPLLSSPLRPDPYFLSSSQDSHECGDLERRRSAEQTAFEPESDEEGSSDCEDHMSILRHERDAVQQLNTFSKSSNILSSRISGRSRRRDPKSSNIWQSETASFYSNAKDTYFCGSQAYAHPTLPFCSASCNSEY
jgi:hypothetical protein